MTETTPETTPAPTDVAKRLGVGDYLNRIPAKRWRIIAIRTQETEDNILNSPALTLAICANEKHRIETGRDDYPRFLEMGLGDLNAYLDLDDEPPAAGDGEDQGAGEDATFPDGGVDAGGREGVVVAAGSSVPPDAPPAE